MARQAKSQKPKMVRCRYKNCSKIHVSNELSKDDAYLGGNGKYYHPDCYHVMQTVIKIRDKFYKEVNPLMTRSQISTLVETIHNIVFTKKVDIDMLLFALEYYIKFKPEKLNYPAGLHYIIQDKDVRDVWEKMREDKLRREMKEVFDNSIKSDDIDVLDLNESSSFKFRPNNMNSRFARVIGGE